MDTIALLDDMERNHDNDDVIIAIPDDGTRETFKTDQDRGLPEGKEYHLFFAYSSDDAAFVRKKVRTLEGPPFNLKCCFSDRDFIPGVPIHENIEILMPKCMKIVLVLTPEFYESGWCRYEERMAHALSANNGLGVIPLVHKNCPIPDSLKTLNYIDETRANVADEKILESVFTKAGPSNTLSIWLNPRKDVNGAGIVFSSEKTSSCGYTWRIRDVTQHDVNELQDIGVKVDKKDLLPIMDVVNSHAAMLFYGFLPCTRHGCPINTCTGFTACVFIQLVIALIIMGSATVAFSYVTMEFLLVPVDIFIISLSCWGLKKIVIKKAEKRISAALVQTNLNLYRKAKMIASFRGDVCPKVSLLYYDTEPCKKYILTSLRNNGTQWEEHLTEEQEAAVDNIMDDLVARVAPQLARWEDLPPAQMFRHRTKRDKMCLCQLYEFHMTSEDKPRPRPVTV